eukprot:scaffold35878_cov34-Tisochrysis_lutea.AAC.1
MRSFTKGAGRNIPKGQVPVRLELTIIRSAVGGISRYAIAPRITHRGPNKYLNHLVFTIHSYFLSPFWRGQHEGKEANGKIGADIGMGESVGGVGVGVGVGEWGN